MTEEAFEPAPSDQEYVSERYVLKIPATDKRLKDPSELRKHAVRLLEKKIGDEVQLTSLKVKKPHLLSRVTARILRKKAEATLYLTVEF